MMVLLLPKKAGKLACCLVSSPDKCCSILLQAASRQNDGSQRENNSKWLYYIYIFGCIYCRCHHLSYANFTSSQLTLHYITLGSSVLANNNNNDNNLTTCSKRRRSFEKFKREKLVLSCLFFSSLSRIQTLATLMPI